MRRRNKLLVTFIVLGAAGSLIAWNSAGQAARPALGVTDAKRDAAALENRTISVRGSVIEGSVILNATNPNIVESFVLADSLERLAVVYEKMAPENFGPKEVVVYGTMFVEPGGAVRLRADSIQVGCSSKY